jgi:hypothetical protein
MNFPAAFHFSQIIEIPEFFLFLGVVVIGLMREIGKYSSKQK